MSDRDQETGPERCGCGRKSEPGRECCVACLHGELPEPARPDPVAQAALFRRTAAMLRKLAHHYRSHDDRLHANEDAAYFERRAAELEP